MKVTGEYTFVIKRTWYQLQLVRLPPYSVIFLDIIKLLSCPSCYNCISLNFLCILYLNWTDNQEKEICIYYWHEASTVIVKDSIEYLQCNVKLFERDFFIGMVFFLFEHDFMLMLGKITVPTISVATVIHK